VKAARQSSCKSGSRKSQAGAALLFGLVLLGLLGISIVISVARGYDTDLDKNQRTERALAEAKAALIGFAVDAALTGFRLGELPCPDTDDDGTGIIAATGQPENCDSQDKRLGRLPWRTLGLADLRDGDGERLWYAVAEPFKRDNSNHCDTPVDDDCINSDSRGTITVRNAAGMPIHDGTNPDPYLPSGAIAVIIAPGAAITRQGTGSIQDRSAGSTNIPTSYLDQVQGVEDNADFVDGSLNGFISGPVKQNGRTIVNDRLVVITYDDLMPVLQKRVAREIGNCLALYASANSGRYPWPADTSETAVASSSGNPFVDFAGLRVGRIPDTLADTAASSSGAMTPTWTAGCLIGVGDWWNNWKLHVFYALAQAFEPADPPTTPSCGPGTCLQVNLPDGASASDVQYVVLVAGRRLAVPAQSRASEANRANPMNYLEGENVFGAPNPEVFELTAPRRDFNDAGIYFNGMDN
jgi:hypothetical protein